MPLSEAQISISKTTCLVQKSNNNAFPELKIPGVNVPKIITDDTRLKRKEDYGQNLSFYMKVL